MKEKYPMRHADFVSGWMDMTPELPVPRIDWILEKELDIPYGADAKQRLDLCFPEQRSGVLPLVILVHGGGFYHMDKRDWHLYPGFYALRKGFALASINYRLAPRHKIPKIQEDVKQAILFLKKRASIYGVDPDNFFLMGTSAGGNLVSIVALKGAKEQAEYQVNAVAALCGLLDFKRFLAQMGETQLWRFQSVAPFCLRKLWFGCRRAEFAQAMVASSVGAHITATAPPFFIQHGNRDMDVPVQQSIDFYHQLQRATGYGEKDLVLDILDSAGHCGSDIHYFQPEKIERLMAFFQTHLRP